MKKGLFNQALSYHIVLGHYIHADGRQALYLRITTDRKKKDIPLNEHWPAAFFDKEREEVQSNGTNTADKDRINMVIAEAKARASKIKLRAFADDRLLTLEKFEQEFVNFHSYDNFMAYWLRKKNELVAGGIITSDTGDNHMTSYNRLNEFIGGSEYLPFGEIDLEFIQRFNAWLRKEKKLEHNSACTSHKTVKSYLNHAQLDKYRFDNPYLKFKYRFKHGERAVLERKEIERLEKLWAKRQLDEIGQEVLAKFLFSCYTGLRISDSAQIDSRMISGGKLRLSTAKGFNSGKKVIIFLPDFAQEIIKGRRGLLFRPIADQVCNRYLKAIAVMANIKKRLTFHVSRDTFGTQFIIRGGDVCTLKELMGHSDINTTMIYIKLSENRADMQMRNFNKK
ncbi:MAG TPA: site-specific integrase [Mucilaginibacter sp.]|nr:site-specific integrase [Mucilaginibacter sp.]